MKAKRLTWTQWKEPHFAKAKRLDVKLSRKNIARLHSCYMGYCHNYGGMNAMFAGAYEEHIQSLVQGPSKLMQIIRSMPKDNYVGGCLTIPVDFSKK